MCFYVKFCGWIISNVAITLTESELLRESVQSAGRMPVDKMVISQELSARSSGPEEESNGEAGIQSVKEKWESLQSNLKNSADLNLYIWDLNIV